MEEHPIPQEVSTYEFRLVGDMTIKQFMQVAAGALVALAIYSSQMPPYVKWPLIIISFLMGIALAFFPIEDRPLSKWIVLFLKAIYSPTIYVWDKNARMYEFFQPEPVDASAVSVQTTLATQSIAQGQQTPSNQTAGVDDGPGKLEKKEQEFLSKVNSQFQAPTTTPMVTDIKTPAIPKIPTPAAGPHEVRKVSIPTTGAVSVPAEPKQQAAPQSPKLQTQATSASTLRPIAAQQLSGVKAATFSQEASPPSPPTRPNVIVGQVLSSEGKIVDSAILEIKDSEGRPVRALRSNRLGHFMIVTPLTNGKYRITTEKEGLTFDPLSFEAKDEIIPPIAIWAKEASQPVNKQV